MKYLMSLFLLCISTFAHAQQTIPASGGNANGSGGTATFSIGQIVWNMLPGPNGSVLQGVQQPYEISVISGIDDYDINLIYGVYPNPTKGNILLNTGETDLTDLKFQLFSLSGIMLQEKKVETNETEIVLETYPPGTYLLRIQMDQVFVKLFKIIKN